jgi:CRISPR-associated endonuclease/helicase Cas3
MSSESITVAEFRAFFEALHDVPPFPWQERLAMQVAESGLWPGVIELPTAAGKTAVIDIAVFALALEATRPPAERRAPLRIFFVIDRRIVVDEAFRRPTLIAERINRALNGSNQILSRVARLLARISGGEPLHVSMMRGGVYRDNRWARSPNQPTICTSTVDQLGSRLLFRGYGLSARAMPIHAGLIANDSLIMLDEVHLSQAFEQTLTAVGRYRAWSLEPVARPLSIVRMSATPGPADSKRFTVAADDLSNPVWACEYQLTKWRGWS